MSPNFGSDPHLRPTNLSDGFEFTGEFREVERGELFFPTGYGAQANVKPFTAEGFFSYVPGLRWIVQPATPNVVTVETTSTGPRSPFPVELTFNVPLTRDENAALLTVEEAEDLAEDILEEVESIREERNGPYVQVSYGPGEMRTYGSGVYTYRDPSGTLQVDDLVEVPVRYGTKVGKVVALGRSSWNGEVKDVAARLIREELAA